MNGPEPVRLVSIKLSPVARVQTVLAADDGVGPLPGESVVVQSESGQAVGTVVRSIPQLAALRPLPAESAARVVRLATHDDIVARMKRQHKEKEAARIALLKIREWGLPMKLSRVEALDASRLVFYFTAEGRVDFRELVRELYLAEVRSVDAELGVLLEDLLRDQTPAETRDHRRSRDEHEDERPPTRRGHREASSMKEMSSVERPLSGPIRDRQVRCVTGAVDLLFQLPNLEPLVTWQQGRCPRG